jgi:hypothetical protein
MANPLRGEAQLRDRTLAFNFGVFCELEERTGKKMPQLIQSLSEGLGFGELRDFVFLGLQTHHPGTTDADVLILLEGVGYKDATLAVSKAVGSFFGPQGKEKGKNPPKPAR